MGMLKKRSKTKMELEIFVLFPPRNNLLTPHYKHIQSVIPRENFHLRWLQCHLWDLLDVYMIFLKENFQICCFMSNFKMKQKFCIAHLNSWDYFLFLTIIRPNLRFTFSQVTNCQEKDSVRIFSKTEKLHCYRKPTFTWKNNHALVEYAISNAWNLYSNKKNSVHLLVQASWRGVHVLLAWQTEDMGRKGVIRLYPRRHWNCTVSPGL